LKEAMKVDDATSNGREQGLVLQSIRSKTAGAGGKGSLAIPLF